MKNSMELFELNTLERYKYDNPSTREFILASRIFTSLFASTCLVLWKRVLGNMITRTC